MVAGICWRPSDLLIGAEPVYVAMHDWCSLAEAVSRLQLTVPEAIERIRDHRLARVGNIWNALDLLRFWSISAMLDRRDAISLAVSPRVTHCRTGDVHPADGLALPPGPWAAWRRSGAVDGDRPAGISRPLHQCSQLGGQTLSMSDRKVRRLRWMPLPIHKDCGPASS